MRFLALSDTHGEHRLLKNLPDADVIIHAGDVSKDGSERSVMDFLTWFSHLNYSYKIFIAGNHDFFFERQDESYIRKILPKNIIYLNDGEITIKGVKIWGSPVTPRFFNWAFNRDRGKEINRHWDLIPPDTDIVITHGPPKGCLDNIGDESVGCLDLLERVMEIKPKVHVFGHIHEGYGTSEINDVRYINASVLDDHYAVRNRPVLFNV